MALLAKKLSAIGAFFAASILLFLYAYHSFMRDVSEQLTSIESHEPLIIVSTFHGYLPGMVLVSVGMMLFALAMAVFLYRESWYKKLAPVCSVFVGAGVIAIFIGAVASGFYWSDVAEKAGYVRCGLTGQVSSAKVHTNYWATSATICDDPQVGEWLNHSSRGNLERVNRKLEKLGY